MLAVKLATALPYSPWATANVSLTDLPQAQGTYEVCVGEGGRRALFIARFRFGFARRRRP